MRQRCASLYVLYAKSRMPGHAYSTSYLPSLSFEASGEHCSPWSFLQVSYIFSLAPSIQEDVEYSCRNTLCCITRCLLLPWNGFHPIPMLKWVDKPCLDYWEKQLCICSELCQAKEDRNFLLTNLQRYYKKGSNYLTKARNMD